MNNSLQAHLDPNTGAKRILSLSGGGVRGLLTLGALERLEQMLRTQTGNPRYCVSDHFDLICGTSTGAIIATGLALGWQVSDIKAMYDQLCPVLFKPNRRLGVIMPKHDAVLLEKTLDQYLVDEKGMPLRLGSDALRTGLLICAKRIDTDSAWILSNNPRSRFFSPQDGQTWLPNREYKLKDLIRASTAAPTYLSPMTIQISDGKHGFEPEVGVFVDGAIGGHNCPALAAFQLTTLPSYGFNWKAGEENLAILSIGTGQYRQRAEPKEFLNRRTIAQGIGALSGMISESQRNTLLMMQAMSNPRKPWPLNTEIGGLQDELLTPHPLFKFQHHDVNIDNDDLRDRLKLETMKGSKVDKVRKGLRDMANGRKQNLKYCYQLGVSLGGDFEIDDLFL